jgi:hypothetical protein
MDDTKPSEPVAWVYQFKGAERTSPNRVITESQWAESTIWEEEPLYSADTILRLERELETLDADRTLLRGHYLQRTEAWALMKKRAEAAERERDRYKALSEGWTKAADAARQPDAFYEKYNEATMRAMQALLHEAEAERDDTIKRMDDQLQDFEDELKREHAKADRLREVLWEAREVFANCPACADRVARIDALLNEGTNAEPYCSCPPTQCHGEAVNRCRWRLMGYSPPATDTKREPVAAQVPLAEQLARVPADARLIYEHSPTEHSFIPVGPMCHEAAALIDCLAAEKVIANNRVTILRGRAEAAEAENANLREGLRQLIRGYVNTLENGRDRIVSLGGQCDPLEVMERDDPHLRAARALLDGGSHE